MNKDIKDHASLGGKKRAESLTAQERSASASNAAKDRWAKHRLKKNHTCVNLCRCSACGRLKYKHVKGGDLCQQFSCDTLG